jgi:putative PIN family toxin of toxin-antitoxin system
VGAVFDSGVWISAIRYGGVPRQAILRAVSQDQIVICAEIEVEIFRIMQRKFMVAEIDVRKGMEVFLQGSRRVALTGAVSGVCRDAKDDFILECAVVGGAELIVTGDKDLLALGSYGGMGVVTPRQYLDDTGERVRSQ